MTSPDVFHNRSMVAWLESNMPQPSHVPEDLAKNLGPNPLIHLCPIIAEYMGPNPYYSIPDTNNFQIRHKIKTVREEHGGLFDQYDIFFLEMQSTNTPIIPTPFPRFDDVLMASVAAAGLDLPQMTAQQKYIQMLLKAHHKFSKPGSNYLYRYLPPLQQNTDHTYSMTGGIVLYDGSLLMANENNLFLWPARHTPPSPRPPTKGQDPLEAAIEEQMEKGTKVIDLHQIFANIPDAEKARFYAQNPHFGDLNSPTFEDVYEEALANDEGNPKRRPALPNQTQLNTNKSMIAYLTDTYQKTNAIYRKNRIKNLLPHLESAPELVHTYDIATNKYNSDIFLDRLPHQLSHQQLRMWKRRKREFIQEALADDAIKHTNPRQLTDAFFEANGLPLLDEDQILIDDLSEGDDQSYSESDLSDSDEDSDGDSDYSSSGDNDSSDSGEEGTKKAGKSKHTGGRSRICCPHGHSLYTALVPIEPLYHVDPRDDVLLRNYGISMHSSRLFVTGCQDGHVVLHDALTGFCRVIGESKYAIVQVATIATHQHGAQLPAEILSRIVANAEAYNFVEKLRNDTPTTTNSSTDPATTTTFSLNTNDNNNNTSDDPAASAQVIYHPTNRVFPIIVSLDQTGAVMFWDAISGTCLAQYSQDHSTDANPQPPLPKGAKPPLPYNYTGMMKMSMCSIPLLPHVQRQERYGPQRIRPPSKTAYESATSSVMSMVFNMKPGETHQTQPAPQYDISRQPWTPFIGFPFHIAAPRLNNGLLVQLHSPNEKFYVDPHFSPTSSSPKSPHNLAAPIRATFTTPTVIVTPYKKGQLTFCDMKNINQPTFYTFAHKQHITCLAYVGGLLWTAGWDCVIKSWDLRYLSTPVHTIVCSQKHITALSGLDDKYIIMTTAEKQMKIFDIEHLAINRTYSMHVLADCEIYLKSVDFEPFNKELQENETKLENLRQKFHQYRQDQAKIASVRESAPSPNASSSYMATDATVDNKSTPQNPLTEDGAINFEAIYTQLSIAPADRPKPIAALLKNDPFTTSSYQLMSIYPNLIYTQVFQQWLLTNNLSYSNNRFWPLITSYDLVNGCVVTNMSTNKSNHGRNVPVARNQSQRSEFSLQACIFDWDLDELIQNIMVADGIIFTMSKECKAKVGLNKFVGSITPWVTSVDLNDGDDIQ